MTIDQAATTAFRITPPAPQPPPIIFVSLLISSLCDYLNNRLSFRDQLMMIEIVICTMLTSVFFLNGLNILRGLPRSSFRPPSAAARAPFTIWCQAADAVCSSGPVNAAPRMACCHDLVNGTFACSASTTRLLPAHFFSITLCRRLEGRPFCFQHLMRDPLVRIAEDLMPECLHLLLRPLTPQLVQLRVDRLH